MGTEQSLRKTGKRLWALICDTEPGSRRRARGSGCGRQRITDWMKEAGDKWVRRGGLRLARGEGCGSRDRGGKGWPGRRRGGLSPSEAGAECMPQLLCCSPAPGNASDVGLSHRHTRPHRWHIQHVTDPVALPQEITRVRVTKVTHNESCPARPLSVSLLFEHLAITPPSLCCEHFTVKPPIMSNARKY